MSIAYAGSARATMPRWAIVVGIALLAYAVVGNYVALPGYRRFLEGGGSSEDTETLELIWGATRTIVWMLSFHVGAGCLAYAALRARGESTRSFRRWFLIGVGAWIVLWGIPNLPGPYTWFFAGVGVVILTMIIAFFLAAGRNPASASTHAFAGFRGPEWQVVSYLFFAYATWDACGLGSVGGILDPDSSVRESSQDLVVAQTTKLIIEFLIAWALLAVAAFPRVRQS